MKRTIWVPSEQLHEVQKNIQTIQNKAKKLGLDVPSIRKTGETDVDKIKYLEDFYGYKKMSSRLVELHEFEIEGSAPRLNGYQLVASIEHAKTPDGKDFNAVKVSSLTVPDVNVSTQLNNFLSSCEPNCEHCDVNRNRKNTYVLRDVNTQQMKQVGSTCVDDFVGTKALESLVFLEKFEDYTNMLDVGLDDEDVKKRVKNTPPQFVPSELFVAMAINVMRETDGFRPSSHGDYATSLRVINALQNREDFGGTRPLLDHMGSDVVEGSKMMADLLGDYEYISDSGNIYNVSLDQGELKFKVPEGKLPNGHEDGVDLITKPNPEGGLFIMSSGSPLELILDYDLGLHNEDILSARKVIQSIGDASNMEDCEDSMMSHINGLEKGWARIDDKGVVGYLCSNIQKTLNILSPAKLGNIGVEYNPEFVGDLGEKLSTGGEVIKMTSYIKRINRGRSVIESPVTEVQFVTADGNRIKWDASGKTPSDLPIEVGRFYEFSAGKVKGQYYDRTSQMNVTDVSNVRATSFKEVLNPSAKYPQLAGGLFMDKLSSAVSVEAKEEKNAPSRPTGLKL